MQLLQNWAKIIEKTTANVLKLLGLKPFGKWSWANTLFTQLAEVQSYFSAPSHHKYRSRRKYWISILGSKMLIGTGGKGGLS